MHLLLLFWATPIHISGIEQPILAAHNSIRARVGVPSLTWAKWLAEIAQKRADELISSGEFSHHRNWSFGENLYEITGEAAKPREVVLDWASEMVDYSYAGNSCRKACGHYTQLVWRNTTRVGCAASRAGARTVVVCEYDPPGNFVGERPY
ncbi:MAG TPA: CAP domain-containing protein [Bryobacteraceae bacterium]|nr:CAP domain-containing protein [Bryobacteraceae bacterium]